MLHAQRALLSAQRVSLDCQSSHLVFAAAQPVICQEEAMVSAPVIDPSVDLFGVVVCCGCAAIGTILLKPEWPVLPIVGASVGIPLLMILVLPGRRPLPKKD